MERRHEVIAHPRMASGVRERGRAIVADLAWPLVTGCRAVLDARAGVGSVVPPRFDIGPAVEVVDFLDRERQAVDGLAILFVVVVPYAPDDVHVRTLVQVGGCALRQCAPKRPLDG